MWDGVCVCLGKADFDRHANLFDIYIGFIT